MNTQPAPQKMKFSTAITTKGYKQLIANTLTEPKRQARFVAAITSAVGVNPALQECDSKSVISGALLGESLGKTLEALNCDPVDTEQDEEDRKERMKNAEIPL